ncbi:hypothetical protein HDU76_002114, partial [Blyttiomyces sp. JEL0837]
MSTEYGVPYGALGEHYEAGASTRQPRNTMAGVSHHQSPTSTNHMSSYPPPPQHLQPYQHHQHQLNRPQQQLHQGYVHQRSHSPLESTPADPSNDPTRLISPSSNINSASGPSNSLQHQFPASNSSQSPSSAAPPSAQFEQPLQQSTPLFVNARQYHRILKRREARQRREAAIQRAKLRKDKGYIHESRHRHAMRRPRGPGGRFLSAAERAALEQQQQQRDEGGGSSGLQSGLRPDEAMALAEAEAIANRVQGMGAAGLQMVSGSGQGNGQQGAGGLDFVPRGMSDGLREGKMGGIAIERDEFDDDAEFEQDAEAAAITYLLICNTANQSIDDQLSANTVNSTFCSSDPLKKDPSSYPYPFIGGNCLYVTSFANQTALTAVGNDTLKSFEVSVSVPVKATLEAFVLICSGTFIQSVQATESGSFTNPGPYFVRHLSSYQIPVLYCYMAFTGLWVVINLIWFGAWMYHGKTRNKLYKVIALIPSTMLCYVGFVMGLYLAIGIMGYLMSWMQVIRYTLLLVTEISLYMVMMLMSKGWGIIRFHISPIERRTMAGCSIFFVIADLFNLSVGSGAWIALAVFGATYYSYLFRNLRLMTDNLRDYISNLRTRLNSVTETAADRRRTRQRNTTATDHVESEDPVDAQRRQRRRRDGESNEDGTNDETTTTTATGLHAVFEANTSNNPTEPNSETIPPTSRTNTSRYPPTQPNPNQELPQPNVPTSELRNRNRSSRSQSQPPPANQPTNSFPSRISGMFSNIIRRMISGFAAWRRIMRYRAEPEFPADAPRIASLGRDWEIVWSYESKLWLLEMTYRIATFYATTTVILQVYQIIVDIPSYNYFTIILLQLQLVVGFIWLGWTYRLREMKQMVVVPEFVVAARRTVWKSGAGLLFSAGGGGQAGGGDSAGGESQRPQEVSGVGVSDGGNTGVDA